MIRDVLVNISLDEGADPGVDYAVSVAKAFGAQLTGVAFALEAPIPPTYFGTVPAEFVVENRAQGEQSAAAAVKRFEKSIAAAGVEASTRVATSTIDGAATAFGQLARLHDVTILTQPNPQRTGPEPALLEAALFESGRAVVAVPYVQKDPLKLDRVLIAWDGRRTATRAIAEARPFLSRAKRVEVLVVETRKTDPKLLPGTDLARHLARHDLKVELHVVAAGGQDVAAIILNEVAEREIDFVVMGGYGHSRLREFVLGGVTRGMIAAMTAPVLMAH